MSSYVFKSIIGNIELVSSKNRIIAVHRTRKKPNKTEEEVDQVINEHLINDRIAENLQIKK